MIGQTIGRHEIVAKHGEVHKWPAGPLFPEQVAAIFSIPTSPLGSRTGRAA
jgi:hypothetical protein